MHGSEGYDGQFNYFIALDPRPNVVSQKLDVPAYRYQRILLPFLTRLFSWGNPRLIPWVLIFLPLLGQIWGTYYFTRIVEFYRAPILYGLVYGMGAGYMLSIRLALSEPIAYGFVVGAIYYFLKKKYLWSDIFFCLAFFAKEVTLLFGLAVFISYLFNRNFKRALSLCLCAFFPYFLFQIALFFIFGQFGVGSGGANATPFEIIPFMGLIRIAKYSFLYFFAMVVTFMPLVIYPAIWGVIKAIQSLFAKDFNPLVFSLLFNALMVVFLPFSTFRETGGILRLSCGITLAVLLYLLQKPNQRFLRYTPFWLVYNIFLLKGG
ncbi:MAG: hypothetical protein ACPL0B_00985 [Anaerolineales bacterium]